MHSRTAICLLLLVASLAGCHRPIRAITSNKVFFPQGMNGRIVTKVEEEDRTQPLQATVVAVPASGCDTPRIALVELDGLIVNADLSVTAQESENPVALFREKLDRAAADPHVCGLVVRINSPGGGVVASDIVFHEIERFRQRTGVPIVAYLMEFGAGGGYYAATAADQILAHPNSISGGIGVIFNWYNLQEAMAQQNVVSRPIKAGENIDMGTYNAPLTENTRAWLQSMADEFHERFKEVVVRRRPSVNPAESTFDGRVFAAEQALEHGLIDGVGYLEDAIATAKQMAGVNESAVVMYHRQLNPPRSIYASDGLPTNAPQVMPASIPGLDRAQLPGFLYLWQVDSTLERGTRRNF